MRFVQVNPDVHQRVRFETTRWSVVLRIRDADSDERREAWSEIIASYWYPLYAFSRRQGASDHDARDLTQSFFTHLISDAKLETVTPKKGLFRSFLLASFKNFVSNQHRADAAVRRGGKQQIVSIDGVDSEARFQLESKREESPERAYERNWAEALLARVKNRLAGEYERADKSALYAVLQSCLTDRGDGPSRLEIGQQLNLSPAAVGMSIHRMRRRFGELLLEEIAATVDDPNDVDDELQNLLAIVSRP